jgi:signal transduction histidine kinase
MTATLRRALPFDLNVGMVLALLALGIVEAMTTAPNAPSWPQAVLTLAWTLPLLSRRRFSVPILALVVVLGPVLGVVNNIGGVNSYVLAAVLAAWTVGRELDAPASWWGPGLILGINWSLFVIVGGQLSDFVFTALIYGGAWAVGQAIRVRELRVGELARTADELRREQEELARELAQERARMARELHDIVAHSISVVAIQTQAIRRRLGPDHAREIEDLRALEETARDAMTELRRMLGVLRADDGAAALEPQPGIAQLPRLFDEARAAGTRIVERVEQALDGLPAGLELTVYRVVQEALTNVRKHAPGELAWVTVAFGARELTVRVENDGPAVSPGATPGVGHGLLGMRERVSLYDGTMWAKPRADGGFVVDVRLPLPAASEHVEVSQP